MSTWTRKEYESAAEDIAQKYADSKGTLSVNKLAEDVSKTAALNPDGIRTMVRLANVSVFEKLFAVKTGEDRMIEYEPGDAEVVINSIFAAEKTACASHFATEEVYDRFQDYHGDLNPLTKTANAEEHFVGKTEDKKPTRQEAQYVIRGAREKLAEQKVQVEHRWALAMEKLAETSKVYAQTPAQRIRFEKLAVAAHGEQVIPELRALNRARGLGVDAVLFGGEKLADVLDRFSAAPSSNDAYMLDFIKGAQQARVEIKNLSHGVDVLDKELAKI